LTGEDQREGENASSKNNLRNEKTKAPAH